MPRRWPLKKQEMGMGKRCYLYIFGSPHTWHSPKGGKQQYANYSQYYIKASQAHGSEHIPWFP